MSETPLVEITGLCKWFGEFSALWDINLSVMRGEKVVICGPSGSGKSTLIRCINQLEEHQKGSIRVDGQEVRPGMKGIEKIRREVGMVFQSFKRCVLPSRRPNIPPSFQAGSNSAWPLPARFACSPSSCSLTSPPRRSIPR